MDYRAYLDPLIIALAIENQEMIGKRSLELDLKACRSKSMCQQLADPIFLSLGTS
jgi:hypothetical protein